MDDLTAEGEKAGGQYEIVSHQGHLYFSEMPSYCFGEEFDQDYSRYEGGIRIRYMKMEPDAEGIVLTGIQRGISWSWMRNIPNARS